MTFKHKAGRTMRVITANVLTAVFGSFLVAGVAQSETLVEAVQMTVSTYPEIAEATANRRAVSQELRQAEGLYYPSLDLTAGAGWEWTDTVTIDNEELKRTERGVIGRAVVGGLILGPLGAIIGGMSGFKDDIKSINKYYLVINYWDIGSKSAQNSSISQMGASLRESSAICARYRCPRLSK